MSKQRVRIQDDRPVIEKMLLPFNQFVKIESSGGVVLILCTIVALIWANSPFAHLYETFKNIPLTVGVGEFVLSKPAILWINDGLMAVFFFLVGLEIKREVLVGELNSLRQASLPICAAVGGMVVPALIYAYFNHGTPSEAGWGIPMATDIAFSLGVLSLLGDRVPMSLKIFLTAIAIVDDIGAILVIAVFLLNRRVHVDYRCRSAFLFADDHSEQNGGQGSASLFDSWYIYVVGILKKRSTCNCCRCARCNDNPCFHNDLR